MENMGKISYGENRMGTANIPVLILKMSLPMMISMLAMALYNVVDALYLSQYSETAVTALSFAFPFQMIMAAVGVGTSVGVSSLIARRLGQKLQSEADATARMGMLLAFISGAVFLLFGLFLTKPVMTLFGASQQVMDECTTYLMICISCSIFPFVQVMCEKTIQATGNTIKPMVIQLFGAVVNVVLDPIMIFGYLGFPEMGVAGAAVATVTGQAVGMVAGIVILKRDRRVNVGIFSRGLSLKERFTFKLDVVKEIYRVGLPSIIMQAVVSVMVAGMNLILVGYSEASVTVLGIYYKVQSFIFMPVFGLNSGTMPIMAYNYGARNKARLLSALKFSSIYALVVMIIGLVLFQTIPHGILSTFSAGEEIMAQGERAFRIISLCFPFAAVSIMLNTMFQSLGKGVFSMLSSICRQLVVILPVAFALSAIFKDVNTVWYAFPIAEGITLCFNIILFMYVYKQTIKDLQPVKKIA